MSILLKVLLNAAALWLTAALYDGVSFEGGGSAWEALVAGLVLGIVNALIRPVLAALSLPITCLTLGLFALVVNAIVLYIVAALTTLQLDGVAGAFWGAIILAIVSWLLELLFGRLIKPRRP